MILRRLSPDASTYCSCGLLAELLEAALAEACRRQRQKKRVEPHGILARLPFPIYTLRGHE
ncbi:MAG: hypothetical protein ACXVA7_22920 [Isosphaeraceae bacterium]